MRPTIEWTDDAVVMIDQRRLPHEEIYLRCESARDVADAIRDMAIRGAPAIGVAAAMGVALEVRRTNDVDLAGLVDRTCSTLAATRPTAVNLFWALERMKRCWEAHRDADKATVAAALAAEAMAIHDEDVAACQRMGDLGAALLPDQARVLTHCNAGALATAGYGTALGVIRSAARMGKLRGVIADETRPFLQGARLTAWELVREQIPVTLITDNMAGHLMARGEVDAVVVGSDRIAANGDVANKIGTYTVAVLAHEHGLPFYVAAPMSTVDLSLPAGDRIPIEERSAEEVTQLAGSPVAAAGVMVRHPAFDVTPHRLVTAIVTERGVARAPFGPALASMSQA